MALSQISPERFTHDDSSCLGNSIFSEFSLDRTLFLFMFTIYYLCIQKGMTSGSFDKESFNLCRVAFLYSVHMSTVPELHSAVKTNEKCKSSRFCIFLINPTNGWDKILCKTRTLLELVKILRSFSFKMTFSNLYEQIADFRSCLCYILNCNFRHAKNAKPFKS